MFVIRIHCCGGVFMRYFGLVLCKLNCSIINIEKKKKLFDQNYASKRNRMTEALNSHRNKERQIMTKLIDFAVRNNRRTN